MSTSPEMDLRDGYAEKYGFHDAEQSVFKSRKGLDAETVAQTSDWQQEPAWMRE